MMALLSFVFVFKDGVGEFDIGFEMIDPGGNPVQTGLSLSIDKCPTPKSFTYLHVNDKTHPHDHLPPPQRCSTRRA